MERALRWPGGLVLAGAIVLACTVAFVLCRRPETPARPSSADMQSSMVAEPGKQAPDPNSLPVVPSTRDAGIGLDDFYREATRLTLSNRQVDEALFVLKYHEPAKFVKLEWHQGVPYKYFRSIYTEKDAPKFVRLLSDDRYAEHWPKIAKMVGYLGAPEGTAAIIDYVRREEKLSSLSEDQVLVRLLCKVGSFDGLGIIQSEEGVKILRSAVTREGAAELAGTWINRIPDSRARELILANLQGAAARGLVLTQSEQDVSLVRDIYQRQKESCQRAGESNEFMAQLAGAMAQQDFIEEHDREAILNLFGDTQYMTELLNRVGKYVFRGPK